MRFVRGGSEGIHHICYVVEDVEAWREHLIRDAGMRIILDVKVFDEVHRFRHCIYAQKGESGPIVEYLEKAENIPE